MRPIQYRDVTKEQLVRRIDEQAQIIEARDTTIAALVEAISRRCVDDQACIYADELQAAIKEVADE